MKTTLRLFALLVAAGYPSVVLAELLGVSVPRSFYSENIFSLFCVAFFALLLISDYSQRPRLLRSVAAVAGESSAKRRRQARHHHRLAA